MLDIDDDDDGALGAAAAADNDAPPGPDGPTHVTRELECVLNETETREHGEEMAAAEREIERLKIRRKSLNAQIRAKYDRMTELATAIDSGREVRDVACTWRPDYKRKVWSLTRDDTGKTVTERAMSALDLQTRLPIDGPDDDDDDEECKLDDCCQSEPCERTDDTTPEADGDEPVRAGTIDDWHPRDNGWAEGDGDPDAQLTPADVLDPTELLPAESTPEARAAVASIGKRATKPATKAAKRQAKVTRGNGHSQKRGR